jgi:hypothetical protein
MESFYMQLKNCKSRAKTKNEKVNNYPKEYH